MVPDFRIIPVLCAVLSVAACDDTGGADVNRGLDPLNVIDETNLSDIMLTAAAPAEAVTYFQGALEQQPERIDLRRGLASSLVRAGRAGESLAHWRQVVADDTSLDQDRLDYADALIRTGDWDEAERQLDLVPPTMETYERYRLEAMVADSNQEWDRADAFYETAAGLTTRPASVLNNWGFSRMSRGEFTAAEDLFMEAISYDPDLFTAKNNLVMARAAQGNYQLPLVRMSQIERAQLLHTAALAAIRQGQTETGRALLAEAIDTHPQHFDAAVRALRALDAEVL
ncbi:Flp pilus assembly protein TadD [Roseibacterium elongatum DSM 19469]|uniref:Flp pilus assembly protein TadD n=1 Tax=Roseicyclus elongatus DSM 19469 TaxID=1294273 RepID=W8RSR5_9RHOB|nr:tetratricopeptide repeat protein [Roseibacterium elongatum]AHM04244.1 Flp pilus assembly protein TadD [Roseibacterium elongatum DSM 19469]